MGLFNKTIVYHKDPSWPMINIRNEKLAKNKIFTKLESFFSKLFGKKFMYCHNIYALNHGVSMIDCLDDHHWDHIRKSNNAYFLHENTSEGFSPQRIANELKQVVELKNISPNKIYVLVMDKIHEDALRKTLHEMKLSDITIDNYNYYLYDINVLNSSNIYNPFLTHDQENIKHSGKRFSIFNRRFKAERLYFFFELLKNNLLNNFVYTFHNIHPHYAGIFDNKDLIDYIRDDDKKYTNVLTKWIDGVPYTTDKDLFWNLSPKFIFDAIRATDINVILETHFQHINEEYVNVISEKTYKVIICKKPFIMYSRPNTLADLKRMGYKTFSPYIDETYDEILDDTERRNAIIKEIDRLSKLSNEEFNLIVESCKKICEHNYDILIDYIHEPLIDEFKKFKIIKYPFVYYKSSVFSFEQQGGKKVYKLNG